MRLLIFLILLIFSSCNSYDQRVQDRKAFNTTHLNQLKDSLNNLRIEHEKSESYISTAKIHQVLRSPEEKERLLKNLNDYDAALEQKIQSVDSLIAIYIDSLALMDSRH